jgi:D-alanyl-D-alanine carboxypeptidase
VRVDDKSNEIKLECTYSGLTIKKEVRSAVINMFKAARDSNVSSIIISSTYRSYDFQNTLFKKKVKSLIKEFGKQAAYEQASEIVAPPGTSEHQTGLAIDITTPELLKTADPLVTAFGNTIQGKWIYENSWKYGFIIRYQPDKKDITGIVYEPWHLRYVGTPHAEIMYKNNWCLEEYHRQLKNSKHMTFNGEDKSYDIFYTSLPLSQQVFDEVYEDQIGYRISGDGKDGYIITIEKNKDTK